MLLLQRVKEAFLPGFSHFCKHGFFRGFTMQILRVTSSIAFFLDLLDFASGIVMELCWYFPPVTAFETTLRADL